MDLGNDRTLWQFGDTFLAREPGGGVDGAFFLRNTVAVQTGRDPSRALMAFFWGADAGGGPRSFIAQDGTDWFWPRGGARIGGTLLLFYGRVRTPAGDPSGFEASGWRVIAVDDPDDDPTAWTMHDVATPSTGEMDPGTAVFVHGDYLYAYGEKRDVWHDMYLVRWKTATRREWISRRSSGGAAAAWGRACAGGPGVVVPTGTAGCEHAPPSNVGFAGIWAI